MSTGEHQRGKPRDAAGASSATSAPMLGPGKQTLTMGLPAPRRRGRTRPHCLTRRARRWSSRSVTASPTSLTDAFASGHLISGEVGRRVGGAFWSAHSAACTAALKAAANADFPHTPHQAIDLAVEQLVTSSSFQAKVSSLCLKLVHDALNATQVTVTNLAGDSWQTMGDQSLGKAPETQRIAALAVQASRQSVEEMANTGKCAAPDRALDYVPVTAALAGTQARPIDTFATDPTMFTEILSPLLLDSSITNPLYQLIKGNLGLGTTLGKEWAGEKVNEAEHGVERGSHKAADWVRSLFP